MTLDEAYNSFVNRDKKIQLLEAGYQYKRCDVCNGLGKISNIIKAVYYGYAGMSDVCRKCNGEGGVWIAPITK